MPPKKWSPEERARQEALLAKEEAELAEHEKRIEAERALLKQKQAEVARAHAFIAKAKMISDTLAAASRGDIDAMNKIAEMYLLKEIAPQEGADHFIQAVFWLIVAAKLGHTGAQQDLQDKLEIDINDDLNDYENIPVTQIEQFLHFIQTQGFVPEANQAEIFSAQEIYILHLQLGTASEAAGTGASAGSAPAVPAHYAPAAVPSDQNVHAAAAAPAPAVPTAHPEHHGGGALAPFAPAPHDMIHLAGADHHAPDCG